MQAVFVQEGYDIDYTPSGADVDAGDVVVQGAVAGVAKNLIDDGRLGSLSVRGVFDFVKINDDISAGAAIYWAATGSPVGGEASSGGATSTAGVNPFLGWAVAAAGAAATTVRVLMFGSPTITANHYGPLNNTIADPGDAGAIPVTASGFCSIVSEGAETRTLAIPTFLGQELLITMDTDGGTVTLTVASAINATGNNTLTFAEESDTIFLVAVSKQDVLCWRVMGNDGVALSTVG